MCKFYHAKLYVHSKNAWLFPLIEISRLQHSQSEKPGLSLQPMLCKFIYSTCGLEIGQNMSSFHLMLFWKPFNFIQIWCCFKFQEGEVNPLCCRRMGSILFTLCIWSQEMITLLVIHVETALNENAAFAFLRVVNLMAFTMFLLNILKQTIRCLHGYICFDEQNHVFFWLPFFGL